MKKRIFTLLALAMLIGGVSSTLKAQVTLSYISIDRGYEGGIYEKKVGNASSASITTMKVALFIPPGNTKKDVTVYFSYDETAQYLGLPTSYTFSGLDTVRLAPMTKEFEIKVENNWNMPNSVNGNTGEIRASLDENLSTYQSISTKFYNYPTFTVEYFATTANFVGSLKILSISGGNPKYSEYMSRKLQKDKDYTYLTDTVVFHPFNDIEVANLVYGDKIIVTGLGGYKYIVDIPGIRNDDDVPPGTIPRAVTVPVVSEATLNVEPGVHQIPSTYDFSFTIKPTGSNEGLVPKVTTGRANFPDSEGVTYQELSDGSWLVTIIRIQSNINLSISFTTSNASIESNSVWANGGQLYVSSPTSSKVSIYSITGALVKTEAIAAGETKSISLPTGFYVVTVDGKAYKVTVK